MVEKKTLMTMAAHPLFSYVVCQLSRIVAKGGLHWASENRYLLVKPDSVSDSFGEPSMQDEVL